MPISLALRKERGEDIRRADRPYVPAEAAYAERFPLLNGVDPYSNTIFNVRQMRKLIVEVGRLLAEGVTDEERASLEVVAEFCREGQKGPHRFLWFIGD